MKAAESEQENHRESSAREGIILDYLAKKVPADWQKQSLDSRRVFLSGHSNADKQTLVERDRICALEVWCEALGGDIKQLKRQDAVEINSIIAATGQWKKQKKAIKFGYSGAQKGFIRG